MQGKQHPQQGEKEVIAPPFQAEAPSPYAYDEPEACRSEENPAQYDYGGRQVNPPGKQACQAEEQNGDVNGRQMKRGSMV